MFGIIILFVVGYCLLKSGEGELVKAKDEVAREIELERTIREFHY